MVQLYQLIDTFVSIASYAFCFYQMVAALHPFPQAGAEKRAPESKLTQITSLQASKARPGTF